MAATNTPIGVDGWTPPFGTCNCGAVLMRRISIRTGECQTCRNKRQGEGKSK